MIWFGLSFKDKTEGAKIMIFNDNNDDDDDDTVIIIRRIVSYEHYILLSICLVCVEYRVG